MRFIFSFSNHKGNSLEFSFLISCFLFSATCASIVLTSLSFRYPVQFNKPVYCFTNTYQKRKHSKKHRIITYVDGPFYPDLTKSAKESRELLRNQVYEKMVERSKNSNIELIKYVKEELN